MSTTDVVQGGTATADPTDSTLSSPALSTTTTPPPASTTSIPLSSTTSSTTSSTASTPPTTSTHSPSSTKSIPPPPPPTSSANGTLGASDPSNSVPVATKAGIGVGVSLLILFIIIGTLVILRYRKKHVPSEGDEGFDSDGQPGGGKHRHDKPLGMQHANSSVASASPKDAKRKKSRRNSNLATVSEEPNSRPLSWIAEGKSRTASPLSIALQPQPPQPYQLMEVPVYVPRGADAGAGRDSSRRNSNLTLNYSETGSLHSVATPDAMMPERRLRPEARELSRRSSALTLVYPDNDRPISLVSMPPLPSGVPSGAASIASSSRAVDEISVAPKAGDSTPTR